MTEKTGTAGDRAPRRREGSGNACCISYKPTLTVNRGKKEGGEPTGEVDGGKERGVSTCGRKLERELLDFILHAWLRRRKKAGECLAGGTAKRRTETE